MVNEALLDGFKGALPGDDRRIVCGEGQEEHPPLMLIGEAPGGEEEKLGRPFVGKAGKNLDGFLSAVGLEREAIWITNVVKVRPVRVGATGRLANRPPDRHELEAFTPLLMREIQLVNPGVIVTLGNTALQALLGKKALIGALHGQVTETVIPAADAADKGLILPLFALYHPASIIYNRSLASVYDDDLVRLRDWLKQAGLKGD